MKILDKDGLSYFWAKLKTLLNGKLDADAVSSTGTASTGWNNCRLSGGKIQYYNTNTTYSAATTSSSGLMSASDKAKLDGIETGAEANVQSDWAQTDTTADDYIKNKPTIPAPVTVDQTYNAQSANAQSGVAVAQALGTIPIVTVDQTYDATSTNAQSGVAIAGVIGNINAVLEEVL